MQNFQALGAPPPDPSNSPPQLRISGYAPSTLCTVYNHMSFRSYCFEQFFLHSSVANLMILTIKDACLMLNCFLFEKFYLHYALCNFDSILLHCTELFIRKSINREQIFDVTFDPPPHWKILRTPLSASALQKKRSSQKFFRRSPKQKRLHKNFSSDLHKKRISKNFSSAPRNFNNSKNSAVLEPRTGQFSRTWGLEAKAKDLTFEVKDFKMCPRGRPRGQGRPRGLHLWCLHHETTIWFI